MNPGQRPRINLLLTKSVHRIRTGWIGEALMRVRLKADGRVVEITDDGQERVLPPVALDAATVEPAAPRATADATYARRVRSQTRLTQAEFAARIGVPIETVRNWE